VSGPSIAGLDGEQALADASEIERADTPVGEEGIGLAAVPEIRVSRN
jgi:hypothetical protein